MFITSHEQFQRLTAVTKSYRVKRRILNNVNYRQYHGLLEINTQRLLAVSYFTTTINSMVDTELNTMQRWWLNVPVTGVIPAGFDSSRPWLFQHQERGQKLKLGDTALSFDDHYRYMLIAEKAGAIDAINNRIQVYRRYFEKDILFQSEIYRDKAQEARAVLAQGHTDFDSTYPWVETYAELNNLDLQTAAQSIEIQSKFFKTRMVDTETLRLKYVSRIRNCTDMLEIHPMVNDFFKEGEVYGRL